MRRGEFPSHEMRQDPDLQNFFEKTSDVDSASIDAAPEAVRP